MRYEDMKQDLHLFKKAGIKITIGEFARYVNLKYSQEYVSVKPYKYKLLTGNVAKRNLSVLA